MTIELNEVSHPARVIRFGDDTVVLAAGKHLKVETGPAGDELLDYTVPKGKAAECTIYVRIVETAAE